MPSPQWWPLDHITITGPWGNSPDYYAQFGQRGHNGIDLACSIGTPVYSTDDGTVLVEGWNTSWSGVAGGISCIIRHSWGHSGYAHLNSTVVNAGQQVKRGQLIGYSGMTGVGTGPHLHFETFPLIVNWNNGFAGRVNPASIINLQPRGTTGSSAPSTPSILKEIGEEMFIADVKGSWYLVVPNGDGKPRAVVLDGGSNAAKAGLPIIKFNEAFSINALKAAVIGIK